VFKPSSQSNSQRRSAISKASLDRILREIKKRYNFWPERKYSLYEIIEHKKDSKLWTPKKYVPERTYQLPRDPIAGWSIYDIKDQRDFFRFFEETFENLPDGRYAGRTSRGGNKGWGWFFVLRYESGRVKNWTKKSKGKEYGQSSSYYAFQEYINMRDELGV
jgi:hypothetical protein